MAQEKYIERKIPFFIQVSYSKLKAEGNIAGRKHLKGDRIAICPDFKCSHVERVKPLVLGIFGRRRYPTCPKDNFHLVFMDEFVGNFIKAINACLYDISSLPPNEMVNYIKLNIPADLKPFIHGWIYGAPIARGAEICSQYLDGCR